MKYEPCARLTTRMTPKIRLRPLASRKSSAPYDRPLKVWMIQNSLLTARARGSLDEPQQAGGVVAEDARLISPLELEPLGDDVPRPVVAHVEAEVAAQHHTVGADGVDEPAERLGRVADGVVGEAPEIGAERALGLVLVFRADTLAVLHAAGKIWNRAAGVGQQHVEPREPVEDATQDEVRGRDGGVERIAEQVTQVERLQTIVGADHGERMQEHGQLELLTALEHRCERRVREIAARDVRAHVYGADAGQASRPLELAHGGLWLLHRKRRAADEPIRKRGVRFADAFVEGVGQAPA